MPWYAWKSGVFIGGTVNRRRGKECCMNARVERMHGGVTMMRDPMHWRDSDRNNSAKIQILLGTVNR